MGSETSSLPALGADSDTTIVAGFSAGSFMATNLHVVYSDTFKGAGLVAGGPYMGNEVYPLSGLYISGYDYSKPDGQYLSEKVIESADINMNEGKIDSLTNLNT